MLPDHTVAKESLAGSWYVLAQALYRLNRTEEADRYLNKAMEMRQALLDSAPQSIKAQQDVAVSHWLRGDVALRSGRAQDALTEYEAAHQRRLALFENDPENAEMQEDLAKSYYRLGTALEILERHEDAERAFVECRDLHEKVLAADPENQGKQMQLALVSARCGRIDEAAEIANTLRSALYPNPGTMFRLARTFSLCAAALQENGVEIVAADKGDERTNHLLDSAIESLREAIENGFNDPYELNLHPDLSAVRRHPEFAVLLHNLDKAN
jgi:tetratricopeptide (TPR) repeat protein